MGSNLTNCQKIHINSFSKHPSPNNQTSTRHMSIFLGQVSMQNYSSWYSLACSIKPKGTQIFSKKSILELPPTPINLWGGGERGGHKSFSERQCIHITQLWLNEGERRYVARRHPFTFLISSLNESHTYIHTYIHACMHTYVRTDVRLETTKYLYPPPIHGWMKNN
jgi:hypothetical protein